MLKTALSVLKLVILSLIAAAISFAILGFILLAIAFIDPAPLKLFFIGYFYLVPPYVIAVGLGLPFGFYMLSIKRKNFDLSSYIGLGIGIGLAPIPVGFVFYGGRLFDALFVFTPMHVIWGLFSGLFFWMFAAIPEQIREEDRQTLRASNNAEAN